MCSLASILDNNSPYECLHQKGVDYSNLRAFGCFTFAFALKNRMTKFESIEYRCVFLSTNNNFLFTLRDVVFMNTSFNLGHVNTV